MLPSKRRRSVSKCRECSNHQSSSATDGLRKRSRLGKASAKVLRGGSSYITKFGWPYVPLLSSDQIYEWFKIMRTFLLDCFYTRKGSNRQGYLLPSEVAVVDRKIKHVEDLFRYWDRASWLIDMVTELSHLFKFSNAFVVTNETPYTAVKLNQKPLVDTCMWYGCPLILRLEDAFSYDPILILDWRPGSGGTEANPIQTTIFPTRHIPFTYEKKIDHLRVTLPFKDTSISFVVEWAGPYECCISPDRGPLQEWTSKLTHPQGRDSLLMPTPSTMQELMARWLPYVRKLVETKKHGVHRKLGDGDYFGLQREVERKLRWIERTAAGEEVTPHFAHDFVKAMCYLRVVNLTEGSMVLLRTRYCSYACRYLKVERIDLNPIDIIAAEVHFSGGDIHEIKEKMIDVDVVEDSLEVRITVTGYDLVVLKISWLGPKHLVRPDETWPDFMGFGRKKEILQSDLDRVEANKKEVTRFGWPYVPQLTNEELIDWFKVMHPHFLAAFQTRKGSNRQGILLPSEVDVSDKLITQAEEQFLYWATTTKSIDMMAELSFLFRFTNVFVVTNMTQYTIVKLNRKPLVDTTLKFHCPLSLRLEDAFSNDPIRILDWRPGSGGTEQNPIEDEIYLTRLIPFTHEIHVDSLFVHVPFKDTTLTFSVEWCGPYESLDSPDRGPLPQWTDYITHPNATESLVVPTQSSFPELMTRWLPYLRKLAETKKHDVHRTLDGEAFEKLQYDIKEKLQWFERVAKGEEVGQSFWRNFCKIMRSIRVVNLTEGSMVLLRTPTSSHALRYLKVVRIDLAPIDIIAAEVHFPGGDFYVIREKMINVEVVGDSLEVTITPAENEFVVLRVSWFGPKYVSPTSYTWDLFMGFGRKRDIVQADLDRAEFHKKRLARAQLLDAY